MSKRLIASQEVAYWIEANVGKEDCDLWYMIEDLKKALLDAAMLQVDIDKEETKQIKTVQSISAAVVHALRNLNSLYEELEDEIVPKHPKGGAQQ